MMRSAAASLLLLSGTQASNEWDYEAMDHWVDINPFCGTPDQSPINIQPNAGRVLYDSDYCTANLNWTVDWSQHDFQVTNNGHSLVVQAIEKLDNDADDSLVDITDDYDKKYRVIDEPIGRLPNYFKPEGSDIDDFCMHSFHFHWGLEDNEGSEHLLNDIQYPLEVHFVHYACKRGALGAALAPYPAPINVTNVEEAGGDSHELAVVGIFFDISEYDNPAFDAILGDETLEKVEDIIGVPQVINRVYLQDIIPEDLSTAGYFSYEGSLTTPPCTNIVRWHVSNSRSYISRNQMIRFRDLMANNVSLSAPNFRVPQININPVYACMEAPAEEDTQDATTTAIVWLWAVVVVIGMGCMAGICYYKSLREAKIAALNKPEQSAKAKRQRLQSKSSIGDSHRQASHGSTTPGH